LKMWLVRPLVLWHPASGGFDVRADGAVVGRMISGGTSLRFVLS
jgi:hypothetical protein